jgi:hypothetical protein
MLVETLVPVNETDWTSPASADLGQTVGAEGGAQVPDSGERSLAFDRDHVEPAGWHLSAPS